ncbi:MAG: hypothetical protein ACR2IE_16890 [Candidatus Sumerlaeaceae bacterium]
MPDFDPERAKEGTAKLFEEFTGIKAPAPDPALGEGSYCQFIYNELAMLEHALNLDVLHWHRKIRIDGSQPIRRAFVKAVISYIEALSHSMRQYIVNLELHRFSPIGMSFMLGKKFKLTDNGMITDEDYYPSTKPLLLLTLRMYAASVDATVDLELDKGGWDAVQLTYDLRDDLTHPKSHESLIVSDLHLKLARRAYNWMISKFHEINVSSGKAQVEEIEKGLADGTIPEDKRQFCEGSAELIRATVELAESNHEKDLLIEEHITTGTVGVTAIDKLLAGPGAPSVRVRTALSWIQTMPKMEKQLEAVSRVQLFLKEEVTGIEPSPE